MSFAARLDGFAAKVEGCGYCFALKRTVRVLLPVLMLAFLGVALEKMGGVFAVGGQLVSAVTLQVVALYALIVVSYFVAVKSGFSVAPFLMSSCLSFAVLAVGVVDGQADFTLWGVSGFLPALLWGGVAGWVTAKVLARVERLPSTRLKNNLVQFLPLGCLFLLSGVARYVVMASLGVLPVVAVTTLLAPILHLFDFWWTIFLVLVVRSLFWSYGVHAGVWDFFLLPVGAAFLLENVLAWRLNLPLPHLMTGGALSAFGNFTGTGVTIGLVLALLGSGQENRRSLGKLALRPALFGINEMLLFGLPIVQNKKWRWPFVVGGAFLGVMPFMAMQYGWLNRPLLDLPTVPFFIEGFLTTGDWRSVLVQLLQVVLSFIFYGTFLKIGGEKLESI